MANSNRKKACKLHDAKKAKAAEKKKTVKKVKPAEEKPIKYTVTVEQQPDGTFEFHGGKGGFNIIKQKNKALEPYRKCIHNYGVLLELIPGDKQAAINQQIGNARVVHNDYLSKREEYYKETKKALTVSQYKKEYLPALKEEKEYLKDTDKFVYENACRNVDNAYDRFFKGLSGFPKYASRTKPNGNSFTTNFTTNNIELKMIDGIPHVKLPKIGNIRFILPKGKLLADIQPYGVSIKAATVSKEPDGSYRISLRMESVIDKPVFPTFINAREIISVDLGLKDFGVLETWKNQSPYQTRDGLRFMQKGCGDSSRAFPENSMTTKHIPVQKTGRKPGLRLPKSSVRLLTREGIFITSSQERLRITMLHLYVKTLRSRI